MATDKPLVVQGVISGAYPSRNSTRSGHFLLPRAERTNLPAPPSPPCNVRPILHGELQVEFKGWPVAPELWTVWVDKLRQRHEPLWREVGIFHAILATTFRLERDEGALLQLAAFWSGDTNTFVFPWGEATVTLEDVAVLGGLPLLGGPVCKPMYGGARGDVDALEAVRSSLCQSSWNSRPSGHAAWAKHFSELPPEDGLLEHGGFLALWLSLFVLPAPPSDDVRAQLLPVAARLARGGSVALAPAALASIYGDLSALKRYSNSSSAEKRLQPFAAWAPLHILQLWVWERFPELRPETTRRTPPRDVPRAFRRWNGARKVLDPRYVHAVLMSPAEFEWAPYGSSGFAPALGSYGRRDIARRRELLSFAHCLRACELVGMDSIEQYCPQRVARQLGYDQDVPGAVARANSDQFVAWAKYKIGIVKISFIVPSNEPTVTAEYEQWWGPVSMACAAAVTEAARMKVATLTQIAENVDRMLSGWVRNSAKRTILREGKKVSQGSSSAAAILTSAVDEPSAPVAEKARSKSLKQQDAPEPVTMHVEQNNISSEQAQVLARHLVKQTHFGATISSLLKPREERQADRTGNSEQGNTVLEVDMVQKYCVSDLDASLENLILPQEPAGGVAAVRKDAVLLQGPTEETQTCAVTVTGEMGRRVLKGKFASLGSNNKLGSNKDIGEDNRSGNDEMSSSNPILKVDRVQKYCVSELAAALKNLTLPPEQADGVAAVRTDAGLLQEPTKETPTGAAAGEMDTRVLKGKYASLDGHNKGSNNISSPNQQMDCTEANKKRSGNGGTSSSRPVGENPTPDGPEVCTNTLYHLSRFDRPEEAWAKDAEAERNGVVLLPRRALGTMEMIEKASAIRRAECAELKKKILRLVKEIEAGEKQEQLNSKK